MTKILTLTLRGPFTARTTSGEMLAGLPRRGMAILAVLAAVDDHRLTRSVLAALIWGDRSEDQARASLRQELSVLRRSLPEGVLDSDRLAVWFGPSVQVETGETGGFLDGLDVPSPPFEDWLRDTRVHLATVWADKTLDCARASQDADESLRLAQQVLASDATNEEAMQVVLKVAGKAGQKAVALRLFQAFTGALQRELDVEPAAETRALADQLRQPETAQAQARPMADLTGRPSLAVMPFDEIGGDRGDMFADGIVEEITNALSRVHDFHVIARQSSYALRDSALDVPHLAERLGCEYLVEGTVQRAGPRLRLSVQLIGGQDGHTLWSARFDDHLDDLFDLQDRIAAQVAGQVSPSLRRAEIERAHRLPQEHRSAYGQVLSALPHFWKHQKVENQMAIRHLDWALLQAPDYGPAWAYKAWALAQKPAYIWSDDPDGDRNAAIAAARRAAELTTDHSPSLVALGAALSMVQAKQDDARGYIDRALAIDPNNAWGWMRRGWIEVYESHFDAAETSFETAEALSPLDPFRFNMVLGRATCQVRAGGDPEMAIALVREAMRLAPGMTWANRLLAISLAKAGRTDEAKAAVRTLVEAYPGLTYQTLEQSLPPSRNPQVAAQYQFLTDLGLRES